MSELTANTQVRPTHTSGRSEGGQVSDLRREPNGSDALSGGSYVVLKLRSFKDEMS
jgi:hypothetical protein